MKNKRLKIGIDIDDVVFEFVKPLLIELKESIGKEVEFEEVFSYHFADSFGISKENTKKIVSSFAAKNRGDNVVFCEFAKESILKLLAENEIYFITSRIYREGTKESLDPHFSNFELIFSSNPYVGNNGKHKGEICNKLGINYMVEDSYEHAFLCANSDVKCFLIDKPWNKHQEPHKNIIRVKGWEEILEKIKEIKNEN